MLTFRLLPQMKIILLSVLCINLPFIYNLFANEQVTFRHFSVENGLSQNTVMAIMQDRKGFMWFGTWDGLNKFDGYEFTIYKSRPGDISNISTNRIDMIHEDKAGYLWIQTYDGKFHRFDPKREKFYSFPITSNRYAYGVERQKRFFESSNGDVWFATNYHGAIRAITHSEINELEIIEYSISSPNRIPNNTVHFIIEDDRNNVWLGTQKGLISIDLKTNQISSHQTDDSNNSASFHSGLDIGNLLLFGDDKGNLWIYNKDEKSFDRLRIASQTIINDIKALSNEIVIIATESAGFFTYNLNNKRLVNFNRTNNLALSTNKFRSITVDSYQVAWLEPETDGVYRYRLSDNSVKLFRPITDAVSRISVLPNFLVIEDVNKKLWVNPQGGGFSLYDRENDKLVHFYNQPGNANYRFSNIIHAAYSDRKGNLWLCTYNKGLEMIRFFTPRFNVIPVNRTLKTITSNEVRAVYQLRDSNIIVATKDGSIRFFNAEMKELGLLDGQGRVSATSNLNDLAYCILEDSKGNIWIGTKGTGLIKLVPQNQNSRLPTYQLFRFRNNPLDNNSLSNDNIYSIIEDSEARIIIGTFGGGLNVVTEKNGSTHFMNFRNRLTTYPMNFCSKIRHLMQDDNNTLWVATTNGLLQIENWLLPDMKMYYIEKLPNVRTSLSNNDVHYIFQSRDKNIWIGTFGGGLNRLIRKASDDKSAVFEVFTTHDGMFSEIVLSIKEDAENNLWFPSENNITRFNPAKRQFQNYEAFHDMNDAHFSEAASLLNANAQIMFGTNRGLVLFNPAEIQQNTETLPLVFTRFQLFNQDVPIGTQNSPLNFSIGYIDEIKLTHKQSVFSIEYAALDFNSIEKIKYAFKLENFENEWNYVQKQRKATYTNIPKGTYYFKVRSTNGEGVWIDNETSVKIVILPSFWETIYAQILYIIAFLLILYIVYYITRSFAKLKHDIEVEQKVSDIKLRFFTNISHELRTPLTLITGPVEDIIKNEKISDSVKEQLSVVQSNAERMLRMINQILDFRKIQNKKMKLQIQLTRIDTLVEKICNNFSKAAQDKKINFVFTNHAREAMLWIDRDKIDIIVYNLLSNAFKFTNDGKKIEVRLIKYADHIMIKVIDEGMGIPKEKKGILFERFTSTNDIQNITKRSGTGIGLNLVKELVDLHKGNIEVESEIGKGTTFSVMIKRGKEHFGDDIDFILEDESSMAVTDECAEEKIANLTHDNSSIDIQLDKKDLPLILVVEDNEEMKNFLIKILIKNFRVESAFDGQEGMQKALELVPDLIVADLMMPVMDGLQLIEQVKNHRDTCHIPVILLTAKSAIESRLEALKFGADDYVTKPFSPILLEARIENIIEQRKKLQEAFRKRLLELEPKQMEFISQDEVFIAKLLDFMDKNIENCDLTVEEMVAEMAMGRTVFFNKLKNLTGLAPIEFIRELRIKRAAQLLRIGDYNVSQITYMIGMSDSRYFSKCFKKVYGMTPSEYKRALTEGQN